MIRRIRLENWRAYRQLNLGVESGTTFFVAPNGVGKSSLLEAVRWVLSGEGAQAEPAMIRNGHDAASASVVVTTQRGELDVRRSLRMRGANVVPSFEAALDGRTIDEASLRNLLSETWSADTRFVSKTAFLTEGLRVETEEPDLVSHLCRVYSLDQLQGALRGVDPALKRANRGVRTARAELTATEEELDEARAKHAGLASQLVERRAEVTTARDAHALAQRAAEAARAAVEQHSATVAWDQQRAALQREAEQAVGSLEPDAVLDAVILQAERSLRVEVEALRSEQARLRARIESVEEALSTLREAGSICPVCLRELDVASRDNAERLHVENVQQTQQRLAEVDPDPVVDRLRRVESLERRALALGDRPAEGDFGDLDRLSAEEADALSRLEGAVAALRELEIAVNVAGQRAEEIASELAEAEVLTRHYREVALLEAASAALTGTINTVLGEQLSPIAEQVNRRWQAVFPDRPNLRLQPDGRMSRDVAGVELSFRSFSAGEQTVAKLMMRLTTLLATTTVPFCWVDEPLEHLDPRSRHLVGAMLAHLSAREGLEQIFVTTYEEPLARRLAELQPGRVRVEYLRTEHAR